ncbi:ECF transporter S component [Natranaerofaba carboxydovora]|uniref:ECF transporter S component n=1 Tax=Natranaerofaba carboxydovora TaxID=2742683 RepID=UPI001F13E3D9|nr:ECF transporter S component [Natranaerofaba carboxydovora]UMZ72769.1 hypothetical protein ACONDI_00295 [Natranaerofaba carboxydovora]
MLILATLTVGLKGSVTIGALTPIIAFMRGILPPVLGPAIPFIVVGNWLYVILFQYIYKFNKVLAIGVAALIKFLILALAVQFIIDIPPQAAQMLQLPQLLTAVAGGIIALIIYPLLQNALNKTSQN